MQDIPEYNPNKYKKAYQISRYISVCLLVLAVVLLGIMIIRPFTNPDDYIVNVNGVSRKDWFIGNIIYMVMFIASALFSLFMFVLYIRLKQANAVFAEKDEQERVKKHEIFDSQAKKAAKIYATYQAGKIAKYFFKK